MESRAWGIGGWLVVVLLIVLTNYWSGGSPTSAGVLQGLSAEHREAIFGHSAEVEPGTAIVASLANATGLLPVHFGKKDLKTRKRRLEELASGDLVGVATAEAVRDAQAAAIAFSAGG